jgi:hypothetical protein
MMLGPAGLCGHARCATISAWRGACSQRSGSTRSTRKPNYSAVPHKAAGAIRAAGDRLRESRMRGSKLIIQQVLVSSVNRTGETAYKVKVDGGGASGG